VATARVDPRTHDETTAFLPSPVPRTPAEIIGIEAWQDGHELPQGQDAGKWETAFWIYAGFPTGVVEFPGG